MIGGSPVYHTMRIMHDASDGDDCLILGVLNVDENVRSGQQTRTYNAIARSLANRYATIYYVDLPTNHYVEYSSSNDYKELEVPEEGSDFFSETVKNVQRVIHPEDFQALFQGCRAPGTAPENHPGSFPAASEYSLFRVVCHKYLHTQQVTFRSPIIVSERSLAALSNFSFLLSMREKALLSAAGEKV